MTITTRQPVVGVSIGELRRALASSLTLQMAALTAVYVAGAAIGLRLAFDNVNVTTVWPPTGIAVAAIVLLGPRMWPGIAAGALLSNLFNGAPVDTSLAIAVGNTLAPVVVGMALRRGGFRPSLDRLKDVASLLLVGAVGGMLISSSLGTAALAFTGQIERGHLASTWFQWWVGDAIGVIIVAPLLLTLGSGKANPFRRRPIEGAALFASTAFMGTILFQTELPIRYIIFPMILWAALRFHQHGASVLTLLLSTVAIWHGARGGGPYEDVSVTMSLVSVQGLNAVVAVVSLTLAAVMTERLSAQDELRRAAAELEERVAARTAELEVSELRMREAQALARIGSFHWDIAANRVTWTDELYQIFGVEPQEFPATFEGYVDRIHLEDRTRIRTAVENAVATRGSYDHEYRIVRPDGEVLWMHGRGEAVLDESGAMTGLAGFCHDITERKTVEDSLRAAVETEREAAARLRAIDEMKDSLLAAVSHELRTPLTVILGVADTLQRPDLPLDSDDARDLLRRMVTNAKRLDKLLKDMLDLDRLDRGVIEARPHATNARELVERVLSTLDITSHPIAVELDNALLYVDGPHTERIVENLIVNATKHTPRGTQIWVRAEPFGSGTTLIVEDAGPGVPPALRSAIFEPFRQGSTSSHSPGTGIGLSLVARFAHVNGGRAWLEERPGGGASFRVLLPSTTSSKAEHGASAGAA